LLTQPVSDTPSQKVEPLTTGLLLISMTRLRTYAEAHLPPNSRLRQGFLEDVGDLEDADVGREDKVRIVERMWRCWSKTLGWRDIAA
jgi:nuclear-control-of-ATPase protein 2